jgi:hypothetical protein
VANATQGTEQPVMHADHVPNMQPSRQPSGGYGRGHGIFGSHSPSPRRPTASRARWLLPGSFEGRREARWRSNRTPALGTELLGKGQISEKDRRTTR